MNAVRYVVQNPQRAGVPGPLESHRWTSYAATIGLAYADIQLAKDELLAFFGRAPEEAITEFQAFCSASVLAAPVRRQPP
jgi:hypothetical protein